MTRQRASSYVGPDRRGLVPRAQALFLTVLLLAAAPLAAVHAATAVPVASAGYTVLSRTALATAGSYQYSVRVAITSNGPLAHNVSAQVVAIAAGTAVTQGLVHFGEVPPGAPVSSADAITVVSGATFNPAALQLTAVTAGAVASTLPIANAGPGQSVFAGQEIVLDGSRSVDPAGNALTYAWAVSSLPAGSKATLANATSVRPVLVTDVPGTYTFSLVVKDANGSSAPSTVSVSTTPINVAPVADAGPDQLVAPGALVALDGTASTDINGDPLTYQWTLLSKPAGSAATVLQPTSPQPTFVADFPGAYVVGLAVSDGKLTSSVAAVTVTAGAGSNLNLATVLPRAVVGHDGATALKKAIILDGTASKDPAGQALSFRWTLLARPAGSAATLASANTFYPILTPDVAGVYVAQLIVNNGTNDSRPVTVAVTTTPAVVDLAVPYALTGADQTVAVGTLVKLDGSASQDPNGAALSYDWALLNAPGSSKSILNPANVPALSFVPDQAGLYVGQLQVSNGLSTSLPQTLRIEAVPPPVQAVNDTAATTPGVPVSIPVLANDKGGSGALSLASVWLPLHGIATANGNLVTYAPFAGYAGTDQFAYTATDGRTSSTALVTVTISAALKAQTITLGAAPVVTVGNSASQSATATSGLPVTLTTSTPATCSVAGNTITGLSIGSCIINANQAGNAVWATAPQVAESLAIGAGKTLQTLSFGIAPALAVGGKATLGATASSGLPVTYSVSPSSVCSVAGNLVTALGGGVCTVTASQAGNATFAPAIPTVQYIIVSGSGQTIAFGAAPTLVVGSTGTVTATASSGLAVVFASATPSICTVSGSTVTAVATGTCSVTANQAGNATFGPAPQATQTIKVALKLQTITFGKAPTIDVGVAGPLSATASSGLAPVFTSTTPTVCTVASGQVTGVAVGSCVVAANQAGNATYAPAPQVTQTLAVGSPPATVRTIETFAGRGALTAPVAAAAANIQPWPIALGPSGAVYFADKNAVYRYDPATATVTAVAGNHTAGYSGDGGPATSAQIGGPAGGGVSSLAFDSAGNLYIADWWNDVVRKVTPAGVISTFAGTGANGNTGDGGPATAATFFCPYYLHVDASNGLLIGDCGQGVRRVDLATNVISTVPGTAGITNISSVASDIAGNVYVIQTPSNFADPAIATQDAILKVTPGGVSSTLATLFHCSYGLAVDPAGNLYTTDCERNQVLEISSAGVVTAIAGNGTSGTSPDGTLASAAALAQPLGVAVDASGNVYFSDFSDFRVRMFAPGGTLVTLAGTNDNIGGLALGADEINNFFELATDPAGNVYSGPYIKINQNGALSRVARTPGNGFGGDGGNVSAATFEASGLSFDSAGNAYVADSGNNRVRKIAANGTVTTIAGNGTFANTGDGGPASAASVTAPIGTAVDGAGNIYVLLRGTAAQALTEHCGTTVRKIDKTGTISLYAGSYTSTILYGGDGGLATAAQIHACAIATDHAGNIYLAEAQNARIRKIDTAGIITTIAGTGVVGYNGDGIPATTAQLYGPRSVAVDSAGNVHIAEQAGQRVRMVNPAGIISTEVGNGTAGYTGDGGDPTAATINHVRWIAIDAKDQLYLSDTGNNAIRRIKVRGTTAQTITLSALPALSVGGTATVTASASSALPVVVGSLTNAVCTVSGTTVTAVGSGTCTIAANQTGNAIFATAAQVTRSATVTRIAQSITFGAAPALKVGVAGTLSATASSGLPVSFRSTTPSVCAVAGSSVTGLAVGSCVVAANQSGSIKYAPASQVTQTITVASGGLLSQTITFGAAPAISVGTNGTLAANASSGLAVTFKSLTPLYCSVTGNTVTGRAAGTCTVAADQPGNGTTIAPAPEVTQSFAVSAVALLPQTISFSAPAAVFVTASGPLVATASSGLPVTFKSLTPAICSVSGASFTGLAAGVCTIAADQSGNAVYAPALEVTQSVAVNNPQVQTITFGVAPTITVGTSGTLVATASSGLPVTFSSTTSTTCSVSGSTVTGLAAGSCIVAANQAGNTIYLPAPQVTQTITVGKAPATVRTIETWVGRGPYTSPVPAPLANVNPWPIALDSTGRVYFAQHTGVYRLDPATGLVTQVAGNETVGYSGDGGPATSARFGTISGLAVDSSGNLYLADASHSVVRKIDTAGIITTFAGTGVAGTSGDNGPASAAQLSFPYYLHVDSSGNLLIADAGNGLRAVNLASGVITSVPNTAGTFPESVTSDAAGNIYYVVPTWSNATPNVPDKVYKLVPDGVPALVATLQYCSEGLALDAVGNLYTADYCANDVYQITPTGTVNIVAGTGLGSSSPGGFSPDGTLATAAKLSDPADVAVDAAGTIYVTDDNNGRVRTFTLGGALKTIAGTENGIGGLATRAAFVTSAGIANTTGLSTDAAGNLYTGYLSKVATDGTLSWFAGIGAPGFGGDGGPAAAATFLARQVVFDAAGNAYVADSGNNRVRKIAIGGTVTTIAGNGTFSNTGDGGPASAATIEGPEAIAVDAVGNVYAVAGSAIRKIDTTGKISRYAGAYDSYDAPGVGGTGDGGPAISALLGNTAGLSLDGAGNLYLADRDHARVRKINAAGTITTVAGIGTPGYAGDGGAATSAQLRRPSDVAADASGGFYIADDLDNRVRYVNSAGVISTAVGTGTAGLVGDGGDPTLALLNAPRRLAVDAQGTLYISDTGNTRIRRVKSRGTTAQAITFGAAPGAISVGGTATVSASSASALPVVFGSATAAVCTVSGSTVKAVSGGTCVIAANQTGNGIYATAAEVTQSITVNRLVQTISFTLPAVSVGGTATLAASASSTLPVSFSTSTPGKCAISGNQLTGLATGTCTVTASQTGNGTYAPATPSTKSITVTTGKTAQTITFGAAPAVSAGTTGALSATASSGLPVAFTSATPFVCSVSGTIVTGLLAGSCIVHADQAGNATFAPAPQGTQTFAITPAKLPQTISFGAIGPVQAGGPAVALSATASSGLAVTFTTKTPATCSVTGSTVTGLTAGLCTVAADQAGNASYLAAPQVTQSVTVSSGAVPQTITFGTAPTVTLHGTAPLSATASSGLPVTLSTKTPATCTVAGSTVTGVALGTCMVAADQAGNSAFLPAPQVIQTFTIGNAATKRIIETWVGHRPYAAPVDSLSANVVPWPIAVSASGVVYFAGRNAVYRHDPATGQTTVVAGNGIAGFSGDGGPATTAQISTITGIALDAAGNLYIADPDNSRVRRVTPAGVITTIAGNGTSGSTGDGGAATAATLNFPNYVHVDAANTLLIAESGGGVRRVTLSTGIINTVPGTAGKFPLAVTSDAAGNTYIIAPGAGGYSIFQITSGGILSQFGTLVSPLVPFTGASCLEGLAIDGSGSLYTTDYCVNKVYQISPTGVPSTIAGLGGPIAGDSPDGTPARGAKLNQPSDVAVDATGTVYFSEYANYRIRSFTLGGTLKTLVGGTDGFGGIATASEQILFDSSQVPGIAVDSAGNLYNGVALTRVSPTDIITPFAGLGPPGLTVPGGGNGDGGQALNAVFYLPSGIAIDSAGNKYVADTAHGLIRKVDPAGIVTSVPGSYGAPAVVAVDATGNLYTGGPYCSSSLNKVTPAGVVTAFAGSSTFGYGGDGGPATAALFSGICAVSVDSAGNVYVADTYNNRVRKISTTGIVTTIAGTGTAGYSGDNGPATAAQLSGPFGVVVDPAGNVHIADQGNNRVRVVSPTGTITTEAGTGVAGNGGDGGDPLLATLAAPASLALDSAGTLYVVDSGSYLTRRLRTVGLTTQAITFGAAPTVAVGGLGAVSATASSGQPVVLASATTATCTVSGTTVTGVAPGPCVVTANQYGDAITYAPAPQVTQTFTIGGTTAQTITFGAAPAATVGNPVALSATASSGLAVTFTSTTPAICSVSGSLVTGLATGKCVISASQAGNSAFAPARPVTQAITVGAGRTPQVITITGTTGIGIGTSDLLHANASSGLPVTFTSLTPAICTISGTTVTGLAYGLCEVAASQAGNATYAPAPTVYGGLDVGLGLQPQTITLVATPALTVGSSASITGTASSGLPVLYASTTPSICAVAGSTVTGLGIGTCGIAANQPGSATYAPAPQVTQTIPVGAGKTAQSITFGTAPSVTVGGTGSVSAAATSGLAVSFSSTTPLTCSVSGSVVTGLAPGVCVVAGNQGGNATFAPAPQATLTLAVAPGKTPQTITFGAPPALSVGGSAPITATASSGLAVTFVSTTPATCTVAAGLVTGVATGNCTIAANQAGNATFAPAPTATETITVGGAAASRRIIDTWVGRGAYSSPVDAPSANITPRAITVSSTGAVYFADWYAVYRYDPTAGTATLVAGDETMGYSGDFGPATSARLGQVEGLAVDPAGNLYIADIDHSVVRQVSPAGIITTFAGTGAPGAPGAGDGGPAAAAALGCADDVHIELGVNLLIADCGSGIRRVNLATGVIGTVSGTTAHFPRWVTGDAAGNIYFLNPGDQNPTGARDTLYKVSTSNVVSLLATLQHGGQGVAVDSAGNVYTADYYANTVYRTTAAGVVSSFAGTGASGFSPDGTIATAGKFSVLSGVAVDSANKVYFTDAGNYRVRTVTTTGLLSTQVGTNNGIGGLATASLAVTINGALGVDPSGKVYNGIDLTQTSTSDVISHWAAIAFGFSGDGGPVANAQFNFPKGVAFDAAGNGYVADALNQRVRKVTAAGVVSTIAGTGTFANTGDGGAATAAAVSNPAAVAVDTGGNVYVVVSNSYNSRCGQAVRRISLTGVITRYAGSYTAAGFTGDGGPATSATLAAVCGIATDAAGNLYLADAGAARIRVVTPAGIINTVAGNGTAGFSGDGGPATAASLNAPLSVAVDTGGSIHIADYLNNRVRVVKGGVISTEVGTGVTGFTGDGADPLLAALNQPVAVAVDSGGTLYINDGGNQRIRRVRSVGVTSQVISFAPTPPVAVGASGTVAATASSGLAVTLTSMTEAVCTVSGNTVSVLTKGTCIIAANQYGNSVYAPAAQVTQRFTNSGTTVQSIVFGAAPTVTVGTIGTLAATTSSGLVPVFTSTTPATCQVSGNAVFGVATGTCVIAANQPGNAIYAPAPQVTQSVVVGVAAAFAYVTNAGSASVSQYSIAADGSLVPLATATVPAGAQPTSITRDVFGRYAYVANVGTGGGISQYTIGADGVLTPMSPALVATGNQPQAVVVDPTGQYAYVANWQDSTVSQYQLATSPPGSLLPLAVPTVPSGSLPYDLAVSPTGLYVYAANSGDNTVSQYAIGADGTLSVLAPAVGTGAGTGAQAVSVTVHPTGLYVYVANSGGSSVSQFAVGADGTLSPLPTPRVTTAGTRPQSVAVDPTGRFAYVTNRDTASISQYSVGADGSLTPLSPATVSTGANTEPRRIRLDASGRYAYVTSMPTTVAGAVSTVLQFAVGATGQLTPLPAPRVAAQVNPTDIMTAGSGVAGFGGAFIITSGAGEINAATHEVWDLSGSVLVLLSSSLAEFGGQVAISDGGVPVSVNPVTPFILNGAPPLMTGSGPVFNGDVTLTVTVTSLSAGGASGTITYKDNLGGGPPISWPFTAAP